MASRKPPDYIYAEGQSFAGFVRENLKTILSESRAGLTYELIAMEVSRQTPFKVTKDTFTVTVGRERRNRQTNKTVAPPQLASSR